MQKLSKDTVIFYHEGTLNGRAAAYAAWRRLQHSAHYEGIDYSSLDRFQDYDLTGKVIYILGLSIARKHIDNALYVAKRVVFIDHHPSTRAVFDPIAKQHDNVELIHTQDRASCCLTWSHFVEDEPVSQFFLAIEDVLFNRNPPKVPNSTFICMGLSVYSDFVSLNSFFQNTLNRNLLSGMSDLISEGHHYNKLINSLVNSYNDKAEYYEILDRQVPILNIPKTFVDPCLIKLSETTGVAISYVDSGAKRFWSIRTTLKSNLNAGKISQLMEGGGSTTVGGFTTNTKILPEDLDRLMKSFQKDKSTMDYVKIHSGTGE